MTIHLTFWPVYCAVLVAYVLFGMWWSDRNENDVVKALGWFAGLLLIIGVAIGRVLP